MSTPGSTPTPPPPGYSNVVPPGSISGPHEATTKRPGEIKLISRSMLFYWWPVWAMAFFCALWTFIEDNRLAVLPSHTRVLPAVKEVVKDKDGNPVKDAEGKTVERVRWLDEVKNEEEQKATQEGKVPPPVEPNAFVIDPDLGGKNKHWKYDDHPLGEAARLSRTEGNEPWTTRVSRYPGLGMAFVFTLLLVIFTTNVPLRGLWAFVALLLIALVVVIISLVPGAWDNIGRTLASWLVYINLATYLIIGGVVFIIWAVAFFIFDPQQFVIFAPGQIRVCEHIGDAVEAYSSAGVQLTKQRDDPFRHLLLGFGSSDLILKFATGDRREIRIPNVLGLNFSIARVEDMIRTVPS